VRDLYSTPADNGDPIPGSPGFSCNQARTGRTCASVFRNLRLLFSDSTVDALNQDDLKSLDASVSVNITDHLALTFDGVNLTNEEIVQFASDSFRPRAVYDNGRIYFVGARFKF
jgi:iron complex outermembrane receptor protein